MNYQYKGYTIKSFKHYYLILNADGEQVATADNINDAKYTINNILNNDI